jgi:predicted nucleic acid-binding protein
MSQLTIVWGVTGNFDKGRLNALLKEKGFNQVTPTKSIRAAWASDFLRVQLFEKSLLTQGKRTIQNATIVQKIHALGGLSLDNKNQKIYDALQPKPNAILCDTCSLPTYLIEGSVESMKVVFKNECGHANQMQPPFMVLNMRILPDLNILVGNSLSRFISLGLFIGFEVVLPDFLIHAVDTFIGRKEKSGAVRELQNLKKSEQDAKIKIFSPVCDPSLKKLSKQDFATQEDDIILQLADQTNSILITADNTLAMKARIKNRPVIHIPSSVDSKLKYITATRL